MRNPSRWIPDSSRRSGRTIPVDGPSNLAVAVVPILNGGDKWSAICRDSFGAIMLESEAPRTKSEAYTEAEAFAQSLAGV